MRAPTPRGAGLLLACACVPEAVDPSPPPSAPDLADCGATCGGPLFLLDEVVFVVAEAGAPLPGFDLDGVDDDCGFADATGPDGEAGVDNRLATLFDVLPPTLASTLPAIFADAIAAGGLTVLVELGGVSALDEAGPALVVFRAGDGPIAVGPDGRPLSHQTFDLGVDPLLGAGEGQLHGDGALEAGPLDLALRIAFLDAEVAFRLRRARLHLREEAPGGRLVGLLGGVVPVDDVLAVAGRLGGDGDAAIRAGIEAVVPLAIDARTEPGGACDGISGAFGIGAVPAFVFGDGP